MMTIEKYWVLVGNVFKTLEKAFASLEPGIAEFKLSAGNAIFLFNDGTEGKLAPEPSQRHLLLETTLDEEHYRFYFDLLSDAWLDEKGSGIELEGHIAGLLRSDLAPIWWTRKSVV